ncbi:unnamed protein product [Amoebophrya sp. A25]|nr:unnamed protein product [Amoebophrya sp. A25]|eukprot:GSA25T00007497001.1
MAAHHILADHAQHLLTCCTPSLSSSSSTSLSRRPPAELEVATSFAELEPSPYQVEISCPKEHESDAQRFWRPSKETTHEARLRHRVEKMTPGFIETALSFAVPFGTALLGGVFFRYYKDSKKREARVFEEEERIRRELNPTKEDLHEMNFDDGSIDHPPTSPGMTTSRDASSPGFSPGGGGSSPGFGGGGSSPALRGSQR